MAAKAPVARATQKAELASEGRSKSRNKRNHTGSDVQDAHSASLREDDATSGAQSEDDSMGQEQSRAEKRALSANIRAAANDVRHEEGRRGSGKLKRITTGNSTVDSVPPRPQHKFTQEPRVDTYDDLSSPDKVTASTTKRALHDGQAFLPRKRVARSTPQSLAEREAEDQRLANLQLRANGQTIDASQTFTDHEDHNASGGDAEDAWKYRDVFSDRQVENAKSPQPEDSRPPQDDYTHDVAQSDVDIEPPAAPVRKSPRKPANAQRSQHNLNAGDAGSSTHATKTRTVARSKSALSKKQSSHSVAVQSNPHEASSAKRARGRPKKTASTGQDETDRVASEPSRRRSSRTANSTRDAKQPAGKKKTAVERVDPADVQFPPGQNDDDDGESGQKGNSTPGSKAHKVSKHPRRANTSAKRGPANDEPVPETEPLPVLELEQQRRLFGLWPRLLQIIRHADSWIAKRLRCDDARVRKLIRKCQKLISHLETPEAAEGSSSDFNAEEASQEIAATAEELCSSGPTLKGDAHTDRGDDIFANLIPVLVKILEAKFCYLERRAGTQDGSTVISLAFESEFLENLQFVEDVGYLAKKGFRPHQDYRVKANIHGHINIPLRELRADLSKHYERRRRAAEARARAIQQDGKRRLGAQSQERQTRQTEFRKRLDHKWKDLHNRRYLAEGNALRLGLEKGGAKMDHIAYPDYRPELDADGEPFTRMQMFAVRIGPTQPAIDAARQNQWSLAELDALQGGLKRFAGDSVIEDIICEHCQPNGVLNRFSVTEIVVQAADLKAFYEPRQLENSSVVEDWVKAIPVWTRPQAMPGQENERIIVSDDHEMPEGDEKEGEAEEEAQDDLEDAEEDEEAVEAD